MAAKVPAAVTRKVGPAPVWLWVVAVVLLYMVYQRFGGAGSASAASAPAVQATGASQGDGGGGNGAGSLTADLLAALGQTGVHDAYNTWSWSTVDSHDVTTTTTTGDTAAPPVYIGGPYYPPSPSPTPSPSQPWPGADVRPIVISPWPIPSTGAAGVGDMPVYPSMPLRPIGHNIGSLKPVLQPEG